MPAEPQDALPEMPAGYTRIFLHGPKSLACTVLWKWPCGAVRAFFNMRPPWSEGATHALHGLAREGNPGPTVSRRMPAQKEAVYETDATGPTDPVDAVHQPV